MDAARIGASLATICAADHLSVSLLGDGHRAQLLRTRSHAGIASGALSAKLRRASSNAYAEVTARARPAEAKSIRSPGALWGL
jgi:hypothetical protein